MAEMMITYKQEGEYLIPNLEVPTTDKPIGKYGMMRKTFLKQHHKSLYTAMMLQGTLMEHLSEIDTEAKRQVEQIVSKMAQAENITEELKAKDPMKWTGLMNNLLHSAEEIVLSEVVNS